MNKSIFLAVITSFFTHFVSAQDSTLTKTNELYFTVADINPVNIHLKYKRQLRETTYWKVGLVSLSASSNSQKTDYPYASQTTNQGYSAGLESGLEFRKAISPRFSFFHGPNIRYEFLYGASVIENESSVPLETKSTVFTNRLSIPYTFGFLLNVTDKFLLAAEINPSVSYGISTNKTNGNSMSDTRTLGFGFDTRFVLFSLVYRF